MRKRKLLWNTTSSLIFLVVSMICGFITPRLILVHYGSEVNGLIDSITQCLRVIVFLEFGVGAVVQSALYKPLAENDTENISKIVKSAKKFFRMIAVALLVYVVVLLFVYPYINDGDFEIRFTDFLIFALSLNLFAQYYFGIVEKIVLLADQRGYIIYNIQTIAIVSSTVLSSVLIINGNSILIVELLTSLIYVARPIYFYYYVKKHYRINNNISYETEPIGQKWNGLAQHVSTVILNSTDSIVLTIFSTLSNVSIYAVYYLVVNGVRQFMMSATNGVKSLLGEIIAKEERDNLNIVFGCFEFVVHYSVTFLWSCTATLIVPFISVYTKGITDANYNVPVFAVLLCIAFGMEAIRLCYYVLVLAAGHYKQTQINFMVTATINIIVSVATVEAFGLIGVAIGTLIAMSYQAIWMANYTSKNILHRYTNYFWIRMIKDIVICLAIISSTYWIKIGNLSYMNWIWLAIRVCTIATVITLGASFIFDQSRIRIVLYKAKNRLIKSK